MISDTSKAVYDYLQAADRRLGAAAIARMSLLPLLHRLQKGEGLLLAVNLSMALVAQPDLATFMAQALLSTLVLALLYSLNDVYDCRNDQNDRTRDQDFVRFCVQNRSSLFLILAIQKAAVVALAMALLGPRSAAAVAAVFLVNFAYSSIFKSRVAIDVVWVGVWGALYAMVPGVPAPLSLLALVGVMTSICHVFQVTRDRPIDDANGLRTSAVASPWLPSAELALCCIAMGAVLGYHLGPVAALSAATPLLLRSTMSSNQIAWLLSKTYYGLMWLLVLGAVYGY
jgi:4-hydroxybenzoate polyprenyltransferase